MPARDVAAGGRDAAARILDERTRDYVHIHVGRLDLTREFAIAVVHHHAHVGALGVDRARRLPYVIHRQAGPPRVSARALKRDELGVVIYLGQHCGQIDFAVRG